MISLFHHLDPVVKFTAKTVVIDENTILENASLIVHEGKVIEILPAESASRRRVDKKIALAGQVLHPGFINAHCHLELSFLKGKLSPEAGFTGWIKALVKKRSQASQRTVGAGIKKGIERLIATGTTCVGDVASSGAVTPFAQRAGIRAVIFHETLGYQPDKAGVLLRELVDSVERTPGSELVTHGVSPHAIYSTSGPLIRGAAEYAAMRKKPLAIHLSETADENLFAKSGTGPFMSMLKRFGTFAPGSHPKSSPCAAIEKYGALKSALLIHFNYPERGDISRAAKAGAKVVICPDSNKWFERTMEHPLLELLGKGITVGLGTDSLASNTDLDMAAEARSLSALFPSLDDAAIFRIATSGGAAALGLPYGHGTLRAGAPFDAVAVSINHMRGRSVFRDIINEGRVVHRVWISGRERYKNKLRSGLT
ncbi:MAG: amidohydrolase family protein [Nitrospinae bacterium]|nr:amidohydrolase family protein [Nitrospinota bacterium]